MGGMRLLIRGNIGPMPGVVNITFISHGSFIFLAKLNSRKPDSKQWWIKVTEVIRPLNDMTAAEVLSEEGEFTNFIRAMEISGVGGLLEKKGPYTVFAPMDDVFNMEMLGGMIGSAKLDVVLGQFIVPGKYMLADLRSLQMLKTVSGYPLIITTDDGIKVNGLRIFKPDLPYNKGIIHEVAKGVRP